MTNEAMTNKTLNKVLVVAATHEELAQTFEHFGWQKSNFIEQVQFNVLITGVGMVATAFALGRYLNPNYAQVLNVGIAGSFDRNILLGDLVNVTSDTLSELGAEDDDHFISIDELGFGKSVYNSRINSDHYLIKKLPVVKGISVNTVHGNSVKIEEVLKRWNVETESMEGAAVFYAAEQMNLPVIQIRSISNYVEQRNKENWKIGLAIHNLNKWLINYLETIK